MFGATKAGEYSRTIEMLMDKMGKTKWEVMEVLYFLADSQYNREDLMAMAEQIHKEEQNKALEKGGK